MKRKRRTGCAPRASWNVTTAVLTAGLLLLLAGFVVAQGVSSLQPPSSSSSKCYVKVDSVTGVNFKSLSSTITIHGRCFGTDPHYVSLAPYGYTGKDTYDCGGAIDGPSLRFLDWGQGQWAAGRFFGSDGSCTRTNAIGLNYFGWNDTTIVIHGFGDGLGLPGSGATWIMYPGDACSIEVAHDRDGSRYNYTLPAGIC
ncbi:MAG: hypothetical protein WB778_07145 [Thermoplasmata archaeon]